MKNPKALVAFAIFIFCFGIYLTTLSPFLPTGDGTELITAAYTLGIPHPPGYPLPTLLGHLAARIPGGTIPWRANLLSALFQALTITVLFLTIHRLTQKLIPAVFGSLFLAFSPFFWLSATKAEVFPLNNFLAASIIFTAVTLSVNPYPKYLYFLCFLLGLGLTNHHTIILLFPAIGYLIWRQRETLPLKLKNGGWAIFCIIAGLLPYLYLPLAASRQPVLNEGNPATLANFLAVVTRAGYGTFRLAFDVESSTRLLSQISTYSSFLVRQFTFAGILLGILGIALLWQKDRRHLTFTILAFLFSGPLFLLFANPGLAAEFDRAVAERFYLLTLLPISIWLGVSIDKLSKLMSPKIIATVLSLIIGTTLFYNYPMVNQRKNNLADQYGRNLLAAPRGEALIFTASDAASFTLQYLQEVEGIGKDKKIIVPGKLGQPWYLEQLSKIYPELKLPKYHELPVKRYPVREIIDLNYRRFPIYLTGPLTKFDPTITYKYNLWPHTLLLEVRKKEETIALKKYYADNESAWKHAGYKNLSAKDLRYRPSLDAEILTWYATHHYNLGLTYTWQHLLPQAKEEFERSKLFLP